MKTKCTKKLSAMVLAVAMVLVCTAPAWAAVSDVTPDHWAYDAVQYNLSQGMIDVENSAYNVEAPAPRMAVAFALYKQANGKDAQPARPDGVTAPQDMAGLDAKYIYTAMWGKQNSLITGTREEGSAWWFSPQSTVTRQQMVTFLYRFAQYEGKGTPADMTVLTQFTDGLSTADWAQPAMAWAIGQELIRGVGGGLLKPEATLTRGQLAQFLYNYHTHYAAECPDGQHTWVANGTQTIEVVPAHSEGTVREWASVDNVEVTFCNGCNLNWMQWHYDHSSDYNNFNDLNDALCWEYGDTINCSVFHGAFHSEYVTITALVNTEKSYSAGTVEATTRTCTKCGKVEADADLTNKDNWTPHYTDYVVTPAYDEELRARQDGDTWGNHTGPILDTIHHDDYINREIDYYVNDITGDKVYVTTCHHDHWAKDWEGATSTPNYIYCTDCNARMINPTALYN